MPDSPVRCVATSVTARVFAAFFAIYVITAPGGYECADAVSRYATAKSWLDGMGGALHVASPGNAGEDGAVAPDGRVYMFYGPLQSVLMLPSLVLSKAVSHGSPDTLSKLIFGIVTIPLISATSMAILFNALSAIGYSRRVALWTTIVVGLATPMWHYARSGQEENIVGLAFSLYLLGMAWLWKERYAGLVLVASASSIIVSTRWSYLLVLGTILVPVALWLWKRRADARRWAPGLGAALAVGAFAGGAVLWYNEHRFSNPFETGYGLYFRQNHAPFFAWTHAPAHLAALLVSPFRGLLWFCPVIVILFGLRNARLPDLVRRLLPFIATAWVLNLLLIAGFSVWTGGFAWGPRYLTAPIVLLAPLFAAVLASGKGWFGLIGISFVVLGRFAFLRRELRRIDAQRRVTGRLHALDLRLRGPLLAPPLDRASDREHRARASSADARFGLVGDRGQRSRARVVGLQQRVLVACPRRVPSARVEPDARLRLLPGLPGGGRLRPSTSPAEPSGNRLTRESLREAASRGAFDTAPGIARRAEAVTDALRGAGALPASWGR